MNEDDGRRHVKEYVDQPDLKRKMPSTKRNEAMVQINFLKT